MKPTVERLLKWEPAPSLPCALWADFIAKEFGENAGYKRVNQDSMRHEQVKRNSEFGTSGVFEFLEERASVLYWSEWHKRRLRLGVR